MQFKHIISLLAIASVLQSCFKESGSWKNGEISASQRSDFHELDDRLLKGLKDADDQQLSFLESKQMIENPSMVREVDVISEQYKTSDFELLDEYYVVNKYKDADTISSNSNSVNRYNVIYTGTTHEMYIAFFAPKAGRLKYMITAVFCKFNYGWKLNMLDYGVYTINGKTAPELYNMAMAEHDKKYLINSAMLMDLANSCIRPGAIRVYPREDSIASYYSRVTTEDTSKYKFPIVLNSVPAHPRIFKVFAGEFNGGYYPMIYYQSSINVNDTAAIRKENNAIMKAVPSVLPGIDKDNDWLLFIAFNKLPNVKENVDRYEMDNKLK
jgi:hypothetical protein